MPLGGTLGWPLNGAVSNLAGTPTAILRLRRELRAGDFDVVHLHEPVAPVIGLGHAELRGRAARGHLPLLLGDRCPRTSPPRCSAPGASSTGSRVRIAVSEAAAWTGRRFYGGRYRIIPNGVELPPGGVPGPRRRAPGEPLRIVFVGQAVERKGLPVLVRAFEALREHVPAELTVSASEAGEIAPLLQDGARRHRPRARPRRREARGARRRRPAVRAVAGRESPSGWC